MSILVYDYQCPSCGYKTELFCRSDKLDEPVQCASCHEADMTRMIPAPRAQLEGFTGDFPGAAMAWEKRRESKMKAEAREMERHGSVTGSPLPAFHDSVAAKYEVVSND